MMTPETTRYSLQQKIDRQMGEANKEFYKFFGDFLTLPMYYRETLAHNFNLVPLKKGLSSFERMFNRITDTVLLKMIILTEDTMLIDFSIEMVKGQIVETISKLHKIKQAWMALSREERQEFLKKRIRKRTTETVYLQKPKEDVTPTNRFCWWDYHMKLGH